MQVTATNYMRSLESLFVTRQDVNIPNLPRESTPTVGCTERPYLWTCLRGWDEFQTLKGTLTRMELTSTLKLN